MWTPELRLEKIRMALAQAQDTTQFYGRLCVALAAVAFAAALSATGARLAGQLAPETAATVAALMFAATALGLYFVRTLHRALGVAYTESFRRIDTLIIEEVEPDDDGPPSDEGRT